MVKSQVNWWRVGIIGAISLVIGVIPYVYFWLFPPHEFYCVLERNGQIVKAWDKDCTDADVQGNISLSQTFVKAPNIDGN
jgi:hypothetical protein